MNYLVVGRPSNITNLDVSALETAFTKVQTATTKDELLTKLSESSVDVVVIGAGLEVSDRIEIVTELLTNAPGMEMHLNAKNTGPDGLMDFLTNLIKQGN